MAKLTSRLLHIKAIFYAANLINSINFRISDPPTHFRTKSIRKHTKLKQTFFFPSLPMCIKLNIKTTTQSQNWFHRLIRELKIKIIIADLLLKTFIPFSIYLCKLFVLWKLMKFLLLAITDKV